jgi:hypothetical protein
MKQSVFLPYAHTKDVNVDKCPVSLMCMYVAYF